MRGNRTRGRWSYRSRGFFVDSQSSRSIHGFHDTSDDSNDSMPSRSVHGVGSAVLEAIAEDTDSWSSSLPHSLRSMRPKPVGPPPNQKKPWITPHHQHMKHHWGSCTIVSVLGLCLWCRSRWLGWWLGWWCWGWWLGLWCCDGCLGCRGRSGKCRNWAFPPVMPQQCFFHFSLDDVPEGPVVGLLHVRFADREAVAVQKLNSQPELIIRGRSGSGVTS